MTGSVVVVTSQDPPPLQDTPRSNQDRDETYEVDENAEDPLGWADTQRPSPEWSDSEKLFGPSPIEGALAAVLDEVRELTDGEPSSSIPALAGADPEKLAVVVATADGHIYEAGDSRDPFAIQSISKAFVYGLALEDRGFEGVDAKIDVEPSGESFNRISLNAETNRPANAMINAGAITASWLVDPHRGISRRERIRQVFSRCAGRDLEMNADIYAQEHRHGDRNRALGWMLSSVGVIEEDPTPALEDYFAQCSIMVDTRDLAIMGATLAAGGLNPFTDERVFDPLTVERVLAVMNSCGMYDDAGEWFVRVGLPGKSGVGGGIIAVVPGQLAVATFSPPLDPHGNSVRGTAACQRISQAMDLHFARGPGPSRRTVRSIHSLADARSLTHRDENSRRALNELASEVAVIEIQGDLLFPGTEETVRALRQSAQTAQSLILDLSEVDQVAGFGRHLVAVAATELCEAGREVVLIVGDPWTGDWDDAWETVWEDVWEAEPDTRGPSASPGTASGPATGSIGTITAARKISSTTRPDTLAVFGTREEALAFVEDRLLERVHRERGQSEDSALDDLDHDDSADAARATDLLRATAPDLARKIWSRATRTRVRRGEPVLEPAQDAIAVVLVVEGIVEMVPRGAEGDGAVVRRMRPGTVFRASGEDEGRATLVATAGTDLIVRVLDEPALDRLEREDPAAALELWKSMARAASEDLETSLCTNIGWEPGDHWNEEPIDA